MTTLNHYRKRQRCRVSKTLPCAQTQAHGKPALCHVLVETAHGKRLAHGKRDVCRVSGQKTHGKTQPTANVEVCRVLRNKAHGNEALFAVCLFFYTRQKFYTRQNYEKKQILHSQIFLLYIYSVLYSLLKFGIFLVIFAIFSHLFSLIEFFGVKLEVF